jgi:hypothetical protein
VFTIPVRDHTDEEREHYEGRDDDEADEVKGRRDRLRAGLAPLARHRYPVLVEVLLFHEACAAVVVDVEGGHPLKGAQPE